MDLELMRTGLITEIMESSLLAPEPGIPGSMLARGTDQPEIDIYNFAPFEHEEGQCVPSNTDLDQFLPQQIFSDDDDNDDDDDQSVILTDSELANINADSFPCVLDKFQVLSTVSNEDPLGVNLDEVLSTVSNEDPLVGNLDEGNMPNLEALLEYEEVAEDVDLIPDAINLPSRKSKATHNLLWKFILNKLDGPTAIPTLLRWRDKYRGIFEFLDSEAFSKLWGITKGKTDMTFAKLSRSIRYYYKKKPERGIIEAWHGQIKRCYIFNWNEVKKYQ